MDNWRDERRKWREDRRKFRDEIRHRYGGHSGGSHVWTGIFLLIIGGAALLKVMLVPIPEWVFTWEVLLIGIGLFVGIRHKFHGVAWFVMMIIGGVFLIDEYFTDVSLRRYLWPLGIIAVGLFFIFRPRRNRHWGDPKEDKTGEVTVVGENESSYNEDHIDATSIFGGVKKNILSKNFKGGEIVNIFGGAEIDLSKSDINGTIRLEMTQIFGGTKLIVPSNWVVKTEMAAIFGGVEDKRNMQTVQDSNKVLILAGTSIFAGIDIRSY